MNKLIGVICPLVILSCFAQTNFSNDNQDSEVQFRQRLVGAPCEGCEAVLEYGDRLLYPTDTLSDFKEEGPKLKVSGVVYKADGKEPAANVILYFYHTDQEGIYPATGKETGWGRRHGYLRGWVKTNDRGAYAFYTLKPAPYPGRPEPAHIHMTVLEPDGKYYYLQDLLFEGDPRLRKKDLHPESPRGGDGFILNTVRDKNMLVAERDIVLGLNVPGYE